MKAWLGFLLPLALAAQLCDEGALLQTRAVEARLRMEEMMYELSLEEHLRAEECTPEPVKAMLRKETTADLEQRLLRKEVFSFVRLGDFEMSCLALSPSSNSAHVSVQEHLEECKSFASELSHLGSQVDDSKMHVLLGTFFFCSFPKSKENFLHFLEAHPFKNFRGFLSYEFYLDLSVKSMIPLTQRDPPEMWPQTLPTLKDRRVVVAGQPGLGALKKTLNLAGFIDMTDAINRVPQLVQEMQTQSAKWPDENVVFLICGSVGGKLALLHAYKILGHKDTLIDAGASLDGLAGIQSRSFNNVGKRCEEMPHFMLPGLCSCDPQGKCVQAPH